MVPPIKKNRIKPKTARHWAKRGQKGILNAVAVLAVRPGEPDPQPLRFPAPGAEAGPSRFLGSTPGVVFDFPVAGTRRPRAPSEHEDEDPESDTEFNAQIYYDEQPELVSWWEVGDINRDPEVVVAQGQSDRLEATEAQQVWFLWLSLESRTYTTPCQVPPQGDADGGMEESDEDVAGESAANAPSDAPELTMLRESYLPLLYGLNAPHSSELCCDSESCRERWDNASTEDERGEASHLPALIAA